jgi:hypothetical protein
MKKTLYFKQETDALLVDLSARLNKSMSNVMEIALNKYNLEVQDPAMAEFKKCYEQLSDSIMILQSMRDYPSEHDREWSQNDDKILKLINQAHDPLMYYNNALYEKAYTGPDDEINS